MAAMPQLLVLGGTAWLGRHVAAAALTAGHQVTCLARGDSGAVAPGARFVRADRDEPHAFDAVLDRRWDAVVDVSRQPGQVRRAVTALAPRAGSFVFVSSMSVYADDATPGAAEDAAVLPALPGDVMESMETYGEAKVACEQVVGDTFGPDRSVIARAGLIGGPGDVSDRSGYWPWRFAHPARDDGVVLVPVSDDLATQLIDVRDVARWLVHSVTSSVRGVFNVTGETVPLADHLGVARDVAGHVGPVVGAGQEWLLAHGVQPWMGERSLPLWLPLPEFAGFSTRDSAAARSAGLVTRPLADTLADTLTWERTRESSRPRRAGLTDEEERVLLDTIAPRS